MQGRGELVLSEDRRTQLTMHLHFVGRQGRENDGTLVGASCDFCVYMYARMSTHASGRVCAHYVSSTSCIHAFVLCRKVQVSLHDMRFICMFV